MSETTNIAKRESIVSRSARRRGGRAGFTIVEILVVILIIGILMSLGTGAALYLTEQRDIMGTKAIQKVILEAIETYRDTAGWAPETDGGTDNGGVFALSVTLLDDSSKTRQAREAFRAMLQKLPSEAIGNGVFLDSFGEEMHYDPFDGLGGRPIWISGGPDRTIGGVASDAAAEDDIRSDEH